MSPLTCLDYSDTGQFIACGSRSGVVNIYDMTKPLTSSHPKPTATVDNLTTPVSSVLFNHDAQVGNSLPMSCYALASSHQSKSGYVKMRTLRLRAARRSQSANWHSTLDDEISAIHFLSVSKPLARISSVVYHPTFCACISPLLRGCSTDPSYCIPGDKGRNASRARSELSHVPKLADFTDAAQVCQRHRILTKQRLHCVRQ